MLIKIYNKTMPLKGTYLEILTKKRTHNANCNFDRENYDLSKKCFFSMKLPFIK